MIPWREKFRAFSIHFAATLVAESLRELQRPADDLGWLPVKHARGFWTALVDRRSGYPVKYLPIDPY